MTRNIYEYEYKLFIYWLKYFITFLVFMLPNITTHIALFVTIANIINIITNSWGTLLISTELTSPSVCGAEQDVDVGRCDVATPELTSKHQTNTALLPVIMPIVVSTITTNPQNRV